MIATVDLFVIRVIRKSGGDIDITTLHPCHHLVVIVLVFFGPLVHLLHEHINVCHTKLILFFAQFTEHIKDGLLVGAANRKIKQGMHAANVALPRVFPHGLHVSGQVTLFQIVCENRSHNPSN